MLICEVLESWIGDGTLYRRNGQWLYKDRPLAREAGPASGPQSRPMSLRGRQPPSELASSRLEPLSTPARVLVQRLALIGKILPADIVRAVGDIDELRFLDAVDQLVRVRLLVEDVGHQGVRYRFRHEGFRDAVVRSLPPEKRAAVHLFIARRVERGFAMRRRDLAHVLARHYRDGGNPARALRYLRYTAEAAARRGDLEAAVARLGDAMKIVDDRPVGHASITRRLQLTLQHIDILLDFGRARDALARANPEVAADARSPARMQAELLLRRAECQSKLGRLDETLSTLSRMPDPSPTRTIAATALSLEGRARALRGEYPLAQRALESARSTAVHGHLDRLADQLDGELADVLLRQGRYAEALDKLSAALRGARERKDTRSLVELIGSVGIVRAAHGDDEQALVHYREALELAESRGIRADLERWSGALGVLLADVGDDEGAMSHLHRALDISREVGNRQGEAMWRAELGRAHLKAARAEKAAAELHRSLEIARDIGFALYEGYALVYLGAAARDQGMNDFTEARHHLEAGLEIAETLAHDELTALALTEMGQVVRAEGDPQGAHSWFQRARAAAARGQNLRLRQQVQQAAQAAP